MSSVEEDQKWRREFQERWGGRVSEGGAHTLTLLAFLCCLYNRSKLLQLGIGQDLKES